MKIHCATCGKPLNPGEVRNNLSRCEPCRLSSQLEGLITEDRLQTTFEKRWVRELFLGYYHFLTDQQLGVRTMCKNMRKSISLFKVIDDKLLSRRDVTYDWVVTQLAEINKPQFGRSLIAFFMAERLVFVSDDESVTQAIERMIERVPEAFRRLLQVYYRERQEVRSRQLKNEAKKPLSLVTIKTDLEVFTRFVRWLTENCPEVSSWELAQEEHVQSFLLTLTKSHREVVKKDLYMLFRLALRKKLILHVPMMNTTARDYHGSIEPVDWADFKCIAQLLKANASTDPIGCLLATFCLYHGLSSRQIANIKLEDLRVNEKMILVENRPPIYLSDEELILITQYAKVRTQSRNAQNKGYLIVNGDWGYVPKPVSKRYILDKVKALTGYTPKVLRISCFQAHAEKYGPQILIDAFGLSLTQASRYRKFEDFLLEEEIEQQRTEMDQV